MRTSTYELIRGAIEVGDVIAFGGKGDISRVIKSVTRSPVSHVGVILKSRLLLDHNPQDGSMLHLLEAAYDQGVILRRFSDVVSVYQGEIWWLPLLRECRWRMDGPRFLNFCLHAEARPYDFRQAIGSAVDFLPRLENREDFSKFFCSELVAGALEASGVLGPINASEMTPADLVEMPIYEDIVQIAGTEMDPRRRQK